MTPDPRPDRVFIAAWTAILAVLCVIGNAVAWALQRFWERYGDAIMDNSTLIFFAAWGLAVLALVVIARKAKRDPSW
jgi:hypothetical protein